MRPRKQINYLTAKLSVEEKVDERVAQMIHEIQEFKLSHYKPTLRKSKRNVAEQVECSDETEHLNCPQMLPVLIFNSQRCPLRAIATNTHDDCCEQDDNDKDRYDRKK